MNRTHEILKDYGTLVHLPLSRSDIRHQPFYTWPAAHLRQTGQPVSCDTRWRTSKRETRDGLAMEEHVAAVSGGRQAGRGDGPDCVRARRR